MQFRKIISFITFCVAVAGGTSCGKEKESVSEKPFPFYLRMEASDSILSYSGGDGHHFEWGYGFSGIQTTTVNTSTYVQPQDHPYSNVNTYFNLGFSFSSNPYEYPLDLTSAGNEIFGAGNRTFCYYGSPFVMQQLEMVCGGTRTVSVYRNGPEGKLYNSTAGVQPDSSYFVIDSVQRVHFVDKTSANRSYDKIIFGRFSCRVVNPENHDQFIDIRNGSFGLPVWSNTGY